MLKWILILVLSVFATLTQAGTAYSQSQCDSIKKQREAIRSQFRSSYSTKEGEHLTARDKALFTLLANHCSKPKKSSSVSSIASTRTSNSNWLLN